MFVKRLSTTLASVLNALEKRAVLQLTKTNQDNKAKLSRTLRQVCVALVAIGSSSAALSIAIAGDLSHTDVSNVTNMLYSQALSNDTLSDASDRSTEAIWSSDFSQRNWMTRWAMRQHGSWGLQNIQVMSDPTERFTHMLRVHYPAGSASPTVSRNNNAPVGGAQFYANLGIAPQETLRLSYFVRFSENFDFVKGGKLPGLFGGTGNNGGDIPTGTDGFSTRYMWRRSGTGEVYAYLPTSERHGTSIGRDNWRFRRGVWHHIEQEVTLNQPGRDNGRIRVWFDDELVLDQRELTFRTTETLKIDGILFSTFFGGNDPSWASSRDVFIDFADFTVR